MTEERSQPWVLLQQGGDPERAQRIFDEAKAAHRKKHLERIAERKADREGAKRLAKGLSATPTDYPWLSDEEWIDRQPVRPFRGK